MATKLTPPVDDEGNPTEKLTGIPFNTLLGSLTRTRARTIICGAG
jgi:hypothetical protein